MKQIRTYSSSQARAQWRDVLDLAVVGTDVVIERHGKPVVAVIAYDDYVSFLADGEDRSYRSKKERTRGQR